MRKFLTIGALLLFLSIVYAAPGSATTWARHDFQGWAIGGVETSTLNYTQASITVPTFRPAGDQELSGWVMVQVPGQQIFTQVGWLWMSDWSSPRLFYWTNTLGNSGEVVAPGVSESYATPLVPRETIDVAISNAGHGQWVDWAKFPGQDWQVLSIPTIPLMGGTVEINAELETYSATTLSDDLTSPTCFNDWTITLNMRVEEENGGCKV